MQIKPVFRGSEKNVSIGDVIYWDSEVVPEKFQPRPLIGKVISVSGIICGLQTEYHANGEPFYHTISFLEEKGILVK